jgi:hypothetical protein
VRARLHLDLKGKATLVGGFCPNLFDLSVIAPVSRSLTKPG